MNINIRKKILASFLVICLIILGSGLYSYFIIDDLHEKSDVISEVLTPQADAIMEMQIATATGHLWIEEIMSGSEDRSAIPSVMDTLDEAIWFSNAILNGDSNEDGAFHPIEDQGIRKFAEVVNESVIEFKVLAQERFDAKFGGGASIDDKVLDDSFDAAFETFIEKSSEVEGMIKDKMAIAEHDSQTATTRGKTMILIALFLSFSASIIIGMILAAQIVKPINRMSSIMYEIATGDGDLTKRIDIKTHDEIGIMAGYFNDFGDMVQGIISSVKSMAAETSESVESILKIVNQLNSAIDEVANATNEVADGSTTQATSANIIMENIRDNNSQIDVGAGHITDTMGIAEEANRAADHGVEAINTAVTQFESITRTIVFAKDSIEKLNRRTNDIGNIVDMISGISGQTNLLALNASIEAARAGEHGKGFAVVADEVRKLAEESESAARKITELITDIQAETSVNVNTMNANVDNVNHQVDIVTEGSRALNEIKNVVQKSSEKVQEVSGVFDVVSGNMDNITGLFDAMLNVVENTSAASEEVAASVQEQLASLEEVGSQMETLREMSNRLKAETDRLKV